VPRPIVCVWVASTGRLARLSLFPALDAEFRGSSGEAIFGEVRKLVQDDDIIVGVSRFYAVYYKPSNQPICFALSRSYADRDARAEGTVHGVEHGQCFKE
jgi:hypothetical protein